MPQSREPGSDWSDTGRLSYADALAPQGDRIGADVLAGCPAEPLGSLLVRLRCSRLGG